MSKCVPLSLALVFVLAYHSESLAVVVYSEIPNGELSGDNTSPTDLGLFMPGENTVTGQVTEIFAGFDTADIFTFEIGAGNQLDTIFMNSFSTASGGAVFLALDDGPQFEYSSLQLNDTFGPPPLDLFMGGSAVGLAHIGTDVLDNLQAAGMLAIEPVGRPFATPLGPGHYSIYIQETGPESDYSLGFNVSAVPEPSSVALLGVLGIGYAVHRSRKRKTLKRSQRV